MSSRFSIRRGAPNELLIQTSSLWRRIRRRQRIKSVVRVESRGDLPKKLGAAIYIVGIDIPKWAVLECPCRCGERIDVNLMRARRPVWRLLAEHGKVTLQPSLWVPADKCGSHFWVRDNRIIWV